MKIQPLSGRRLLADEVANQLIEMIVDGSLAPNSPLPGETELAERFQVSRTVIREAMRVLVSNGMVRVRHGIGSCVNARAAWQVSTPLKLLIRNDKEGLFRWLEVRRVLEVGIARLAASRATPDDLDTLMSLVAAMREQLSPRSEEFIELDRRFHLTIARATRNHSFEIVVDALLQPLHGPIRASLRIPGMAEKAVAEHEAIVAALRAGEPEAAAAAVTMHLERVSEEIRQLPPVVTLERTE